MNGFPLKTSKRAQFCEKCHQYYVTKKHACRSATSFHRLVPGSTEYTNVKEAFARIDSGTWEQTMILQVARIADSKYYYLIITNFYKKYSAVLIGPYVYMRLKPRQGWILAEMSQPAMLYANDDYSAALIPLELFSLDA